jgi:hypothetical protein
MKHCFIKYQKQIIKLYLHNSDSMVFEIGKQLMQFKNSAAQVWKLDLFSAGQ